MKHGITDDRGVLLRAEDDPDRRIVVWTALNVISHAHVHVHLTDVLMRQLARFEIEQDEALQQVIVENQIDKKVFRVRADLYCLPTASIALTRSVEST